MCEMIEMSDDGTINVRGNAVAIGNIIEKDHSLIEILQDSADRKEG